MSRNQSYKIAQLSGKKNDFSSLGEESVQPLKWDFSASNIIAHLTFGADSNTVTKYVLGQMTAGFEKASLQSIVIGDTDPFNDEFHILDYTFALAAMDDPFIYLLLVSKSTGDINVKLNFDFIGPNGNRQSYPLKLSPNERLDLFIPVVLAL